MRQWRREIEELKAGERDRRLGQRGDRREEDVLGK